MDADRFAETLAALRRLVDCVTFDTCGVNGRGGNGGMTSNDTIRAADDARRIILKIDAERERGSP